MRPVLEALRKARVPDDAIRTIGYDLQQEFDFTNGKRVPRGYVARNSIEVRVDDVSRVGELLEIGGQPGRHVGERPALRPEGPSQARARGGAPGRRRTPG